MPRSIRIRLFQLLVLCVLLVCHASAQSLAIELIGQAVDSVSKQGIPYTVAQVNDAYGRVLNGYVCDSTGTFHITIHGIAPATLTLRALGYKEKSVLLDLSCTKDLG